MSKKVIILIVIAVVIIGVVIYMKNRKVTAKALADKQALAGTTSTTDISTVGADTLINTIVGETDPTPVDDGGNPPVDSEEDFSNVGV